jgi:hypothetical protein
MVSVMVALFLAFQASPEDADIVIVSVEELIEATRTLESYEEKDFVSEIRVRTFQSEKKSLPNWTSSETGMPACEVELSTNCLLENFGGHGLEEVLAWVVWEGPYGTKRHETSVETGLDYKEKVMIVFHFDAPNGTTGYLYGFSLFAREQPFIRPRPRGSGPMNDSSL